MKFFIISNLYEPYARGGAEAVVKTIAEDLVSVGHEVVVMTARPLLHFSPPSSMVQSMELKEKNKKYAVIKILYFFIPNIYFVRNDWRHSFATRFMWRIIDIFNFPAAIMLWYALEREKPDVVMTHNLVGVGMLAPWIIRLKKIRSIHTLHDVQLIHPSGLLMWGVEERAEKSVARKAYETLMRVWFGSPSVVIAPSQWLLDFHIKRGFFRNSKKIVLQNPVSFTPQFHGTVHGTGRVLRLLYAGQLETHKGVKWLLELGIMNNELGQAVCFEFAGSGTLESEVRRAAAINSERIIFHGTLSRDELQKKFTEVDGLVVPSLCYENAPQIIVEALVAGLPIIASRIGGIPELVRNGKNGFLFTPGDSSSFYVSLQKLKGWHLERVGEGMSQEMYIDNLLALC